jgi:lysozyme
MATERLLELITHFEGWRSLAYQDPVGIWTIGYGRTEGVYEHQLTNRDHEERWLHDALGYFADAIIELVNPEVALSQNQLDALTSWAFNLGMGNFRRSTLLKKLNAGDFVGASDEFPRWVYAGRPPQVLPGLLRRREAERQMFLGD